MGKTKKYGPQYFAMQRKLKRVEELLLRGVTNRREIAASFGVSVAMAEKYVKRVRQQWEEDERHDIGMERRLRVRQLEMIAKIALDGFERSRQDAEEFSTTERDCQGCVDGWCIDKQGTRKKCRECNGKGKVLVEITKVKGQAGDPSFLRVAKDCFVEAAKLQGLAPSSAAMRAIKTTESEVGGEIHRKIEELYVEAPVEALMQAKAALYTLKNQMGTLGVVDGKRTIDVGENDAGTKQIDDGE